MSRSRLLALALLALAAAPATATEIGKLFHTPEERARLDRLRRGETDAPALVEGKAHVTGFVRRSDGRNTVWINGVPVTVADPRAEPLLDPREVRNGADAVKVVPAVPEPVKR